MKYHIVDWINVAAIAIFAPIFLIILYLTLGSSVVSVHTGLVYIYICIAIFAWIIVNTLVGYVVDGESMTASYPGNFNILRHKVDLGEVTCYEIKGFDEFGVSNRGVGFHKYKIILKGDFGNAELIFNRECIAREVYTSLKESVPSIGVKEGGCSIE